MTTTFRLEFEREYCEKCGGSGLYPSSCLPSGRCNKCYPANGQKLTRNGAKVRKLWDDFLEQGCSVRADQVAPGMRIRAARYHTGFRTVLAVGMDIDGGSTLRDGVMVPVGPLYFFEFSGNFSYHGMAADHVVRVPFTLEQMRAFVASLPAKLAGAVSLVEVPAK